MADPVTIEEMLGEVPLSPERGFVGAGQYGICPACGQCFRLPEPRDFPTEWIAPGLNPRPGPEYHRALAEYETLIAEHFGSHSMLELVRAFGVLRSEACRGRALRRRVEAVLSDGP